MVRQETRKIQGSGAFPLNSTLNNTLSQELTQAMRIALILSKNHAFSGLTISTRSYHLSHCHTQDQAFST